MPKVEITKVTPHLYLTKGLPFKEHTMLLGLSLPNIKCPKQVLLLAIINWTR